ncbi:MAG: DegT/DnrJ/EryC1/StrS family aminotransferase [Phycisphaeraceae bacterium]|nr:DegT/DnrJ/EryC1/StrS family aminotransferase [Phycisphaeraceae bacterium]
MLHAHRYRTRPHVNHGETGQRAARIPFEALNDDNVIPPLPPDWLGIEPGVDYCYCQQPNMGCCHRASGALRICYPDVQFVGDGAVIVHDCGWGIYGPSMTSIKCAPSRSTACVASKHGAAMTALQTSLSTADPATLDARELFSQLPPTRVGETDRRYMDEVLDAGFGNWESADMLARFETAYTKKFGVACAISHNSGSGTMLSCLLAAGVGPGDEVIVPTFTMPASAHATVQCGAVPVFVDCDPRTFNLDVADVQRKITEFTKAIIPVCLFGLPVDFDPLMTLAKKHGLVVIEDDAQCFLSTYKGRLVGTIGHAASFSFQGSKHMTSGGDGGIVITDDLDYGTRIRKAAVHGYRTLSARPGSTQIPRDERQDYSYERYETVGYNFRMSAVQAALGLAQLERLDHLVAARRYIAWRHEQVIRETRCEWLIPPYVPEDMTHSYYIYTCILDEDKLGADWRTFRKAFIDHGGDGLYGSALPAHLEPVYRDMNLCVNRELAPHFDPRYKGSVKGYDPTGYPNIESIRKRLCQFKTSAQTLDKVDREVDALEATIRHFE